MPAKTQKAQHSSAAARAHMHVTAQQQQHAKVPATPSREMLEGERWSQGETLGERCMWKKLEGRPQLGSHVAGWAGVGPMAGGGLGMGLGRNIQSGA